MGKNRNLYYLHRINSFEDYAYIKKINNLVESLARLSIKELLISEFLQILDCLELVLFEKDVLDLLFVDMPR